MRRFAAWLALAAIATAAVGQDREPRPGPPERARRPYANPSAAIAAEIALARLVEQKGQWTAYREAAAPDAVLFQPDMALAQQWLKDRPNPAIALRWQPHAVWASCDGSLIVTRGAWRQGRQQGWLATVWQRQAKGGGYKWLLIDQGPPAEPDAAPEMIAARVADCADARLAPEARRAREKNAAAPFDPRRREGVSRDGTLRWRVTVDAAGVRNFSAEMAQDGAIRPILEMRTPPAR